MTPNHNSLVYELESRLRNRLFNRTEWQMNMNLFEVLAKTYTNKLYTNNAIALRNPLWDELKHEYTAT